MATNKPVLKMGLIGGIILILILMGLFLTPGPRAKVVMTTLTEIEKYKLKSEIDVKIPTDKLKWFPEMIWYDASYGYNQSHHTDISLTILYSFGNFNQGVSRIFDKSSAYYSSFYGAYIIQNKGSGYPENLEQLAEIPTYDYENLILRDLGDPNYRGAFQYQVNTVQDNITYLDQEGWQKIDLDIQTHGLWHNKKETLNHYIQFGIPKQDPTGNDFEKVSLKGRLYYKEMDSENAIALYIITRDQDLLEATDRQLLSRTSLTLKH